MTPGPKPKPAEIEIAQGNPGHRSVTPASPQLPPARIADAPSWLSERGRDIWRMTMLKSTALGYVRSTDADALARYCDHCDRWLALRDRVNAEGEAINTKSAHVEMIRVNPRFRAMMQLEERMIALEDRFGFSPSARQSLLTRYDPAKDTPADGLGATRAPHAHDASNPSAPSPLGLFAPVPPPSRPN